MADEPKGAALIAPWGVNFFFKPSGFTIGWLGRKGIKCDFLKNNDSNRKLLLAPWDE